MLIDLLTSVLDGLLASMIDLDIGKHKSMCFSYNGVYCISWID